MPQLNPLQQRCAISLIAALSDSQPHIATAAVSDLVQLAPLSVAPLIAAYKTCGDQGVQAYIIQALAQIGAVEAVDLLADVVGTTVANHCQGNVRRIAARGLGLIGCKSNNLAIVERVVNKLAWTLLHPEDWGLRYASAVSLAEIAAHATIIEWRIVAKTALQQALVTESDHVVHARIRLALTQLH